MNLVGLATVATVAAFALPLALAAAMPIRVLRSLAAALAPWAALPALILAAFLHGRATIDWNWALFGMHLGSESALTPGFLLFTSCLWLTCGVFARSYIADDPCRSRFWIFWLATMSGNLGLVLAQDVASFYLFYALMTFAAYGLVVHDRTDAARPAGRVYHVMAHCGEMLLLAGFLLVVGADINVALEAVPRVVAASARREFLCALLLAGFGVKAGALLVHMWLPLAHPVAPTPASAVLSGAMIKAGLFGWLRFLPLGVAALPAHGVVCVVAGIAAAFYGVAIGLTQRAPKTILAYSSVSQMGFMTATLGIGLSNPSAAASVATTILFFAMHHALAKGALFLGSGVAGVTGSGRPGRLVALGLSWPALAIAGAPLSSGALAKISLKNLVARAPGAGPLLPWVLSIAAVGSTLLMFHFLRRTVPRSAERGVPGAGLWLPWAILLVLDLGLLVRPPVAAEEPRLLVHPDKLWDAAWPVVVGVLVAIGVGRLLRGRGADDRRALPPGDLLYLVELGLMGLQRLFRVAREAWVRVPFRRWSARLAPIEQLSGRLLQTAEEAETGLAGFGTIGLLFFLLVVLLLAAQFFSMH